MNEHFNNDEYLYRAVRAYIFEKKNRKFSTALFKSKSEGCSVDRGYYRKDSDVIEFMKNHNLSGGFVKISVADCYKSHTKPVYLPSYGNPTIVKYMVRIKLH